MQIKTQIRNATKGKQRNSRASKLFNVMFVARPL